MPYRLTLAFYPLLAGGLWCGGAGVRTTAGADSAAAEAPLNAVVADAAADVPVRLQYRYSPGQVLRYLTTDESVVEVEHSDETTSIKYSTKTWKHYRVKSVANDGSALVELTLDRVVMSASGADGEAGFDSQRPGAPPAQFAHVMDSIGRPLVDLTFSSAGRITLVQAPAAGPAMRSTPTAANLERDAPTPLVLPSEPVTVGSVWHERFEIPVLVEESKLTRNVRMQRTYTLAEVSDGVARIDVETIVLTPLSDPQWEAQLIQRTPSGVLTFDIERGQLLSKQTYLNNQVVGHEGAGSKLKVVRTYSEVLEVPDEPRAAQTAAAGD